MSTYLTLFLCFLITGLVLFLVRETKLRMALQALCSRLIVRLSQFSAVPREQQPNDTAVEPSCHRGFRPNARQHSRKPTRQVSSTSTSRSH